MLLQTFKTFIFRALEEASTNFSRVYWITDLTNCNHGLLYGIDIMECNVVFRSHYRI